VSSVEGFIPGEHTKRFMEHGKADDYYVAPERDGRQYVLVVGLL